MHPLSNINGLPVDWWFMYKIPKDVGPDKNTTGYEFLYYDSLEIEDIRMSDVTLNHDHSALAHTLAQLKDKDCNYVMWNDEIPPTPNIPDPRNHGSLGHSKGVMAYSNRSNCGFYLLHSTPRFPAKHVIELPDNERSYGQSYLCISFTGKHVLNRISELLLDYCEVQVYGFQLVDLDEDSSFANLCKAVKPSKKIEPAHFQIRTVGGHEFKYFAKSKYWSKPRTDKNYGKDFWKDLVGPSLNCELNVESWRRGLVFSDTNKSTHILTEDIIDIDLCGIGLADYQWSFTKDHAKWAISVDSNKHFIVIADINRQVSQSKRGGGGLAFRNKRLWHFLRKIEKREDKIEDHVHKDLS